jgi:hypothetical protein
VGGKHHAERNFMDDLTEENVEPSEEETLENPEESPEEEEGAEKEESKEGEPTKEAAKKETGSAPEEEDDQTNVQKRIDHLVWEREENKRKLDLLKTDPERYYQQFPEERPETRQPAEEAAEDLEDYESFIVRGGKYDGWTLGDLARDKPLTAQKILNDYLDSNRRQNQEIEERKHLARQAWENDVNTFGANLSTEMFEKKPENLTQEERQKIDETIFKVDQWKKQYRKEHYSFYDAYLLMNKDNLLKSAKEKTASKIVGDLKKNPVGSISGKQDRSSQSIDFESMNEDQLGVHIGRMNDAEAARFYREAPQSLKQKYPSWPWD